MFVHESFIFITIQVFKLLALLFIFINYKPKVILIETDYCIFLFDTEQVMIIDLEILDQTLGTYLTKNEESKDSSRLIDEVYILF